MSTPGRSSHVHEIPAGIYRGVVEGVESGHCTARIEVKVGPGGCRIVDYEAGPLLSYSRLGRRREGAIPRVDTYGNSVEFRSSN